MHNMEKFDIADESLSSPYKTSKNGLIMKHESTLFHAPSTSPSYQFLMPNMEKSDIADEMNSQKEMKLDPLLPEKWLP